MHGFNAQLVGMAFSIFSDGENASSIHVYLLRPAFVVVFSALSVTIADAAKARFGNLPSLTLPFNVVAVAFLGGIVSCPAWDARRIMYARRLADRPRRRDRDPSRRQRDFHSQRLDLWNPHFAKYRNLLSSTCAVGHFRIGVGACVRDGA